MATYKCDIKKQYGKFSGWVWAVSEHQGDAICKDESAAAAVVERVLGKLKDKGFATGDEVIFRDTAYPSLHELKFVLDRAPY
jgi:3-methyladenine DNA glycosylase Tag